MTTYQGSIFEAPSPIHGTGVFATRAFKQGEHINFALARAKPAYCRLLLLLLVIGALSAALAGPGTVLATGVQRAPNPVFKPLLSRLKRSHIPLVLPSWVLPVSPMYATIEILKPGHYYVALGYTRDCHEATACNIGAVEGQKITRSTPPFHGKATPLARHITGHFIRYTCGASCDDSTLSWNEKGYRYLVAIKAGTLKQLTRMANSAID